MQGNLMTSLPDANGNGHVSWDGTGSDGTRVLPGMYMYKVNGTAFGQTIMVLGR